MKNGDLKLFAILMFFIHLAIVSFLLVVVGVDRSLAGQVAWPFFVVAWTGFMAVMYAIVRSVG